MKIIIYKINQAGLFHYRDGICSTIIHIPNLNIYLYKENQGFHSNSDYGIVTNQTYIDILSGISINYEGIKFEKIKELDIDDDIIRGLVSKAKLYDILKSDVEKGIDNLLE